MSGHRTGAPTYGTPGGEEVSLWTWVASPLSRSATLPFPAPAQVSWRLSLTFLGDEADASPASGLAQADCDSSPVRGEVIELWVRMSVTSVDGSWDVTAGPGGDLGSRKGRGDPQGRKRKLCSTNAWNRSEFESKVVRYQHFAVLM